MYTYSVQIPFICQSVTNSMIARQYKFFDFFYICLKLGITSLETFPFGVTQNG